MKFLSLNLIAFGPFTQTVLNFYPPEKGLHLIYGPNEAGKSSALRALRCVLYGIPERSIDDFVHPYSKMRIGATLINHAGHQIGFVRRKGRSGTLRDVDDVEPLNEGILSEFLSGVDETLFSTLFGIDHAVLVKGGEEIITGGGDIGQILFSAGSGISDFRKIQSDIQAEAEKLFKPGGKTPLINESIAALK
ncbi:MAG: AAA family ATPase, partial [Desulfatirhabdiaceae bacterium]